MNGWAQALWHHPCTFLCCTCLTLSCALCPFKQEEKTVYRENMNVLHSPVIADGTNEASREAIHKVKVKIKVKAKFFTKTVPSPEDTDHKHPYR